jgi:hypothetical protein
MKRCTILLIMLPLLAVNAAEGGEIQRWTLGANLGTARGDSGTRELSEQVRALGIEGRVGTSDDKRFAWQLRLGYAFTPRWGVEVGYVDLGKVETTFTGTAIDFDAVLSNSRHIHPHTADGLLLSGIYRHPIGGIPQFEGVARAGAFVWSSEYELNAANSSRTVDEHGTDLSFGLGLSLGLDRLESLPSGTAAQLEWQRFNLDSEWIDLFSVGLSFRFH